MTLIFQPRSFSFPEKSSLKLIKNPHISNSMGKCNGFFLLWVIGIIILPATGFFNPDQKDPVPKVSATPATSATPSVSVVKTVSPASISESELAFVDIRIKNQSPKDIRNIELLEILPAIFDPQSEDFGENNVLYRIVDLIKKGNSYSTSYAFKLSPGIEIPESLKLRLTPTFISFQMSGESRIQFASSAPVELTITHVPVPPKPDPYLWAYYVAALLVISFLFGLSGGLVNYRIGRPLQRGDVYTSSIDLSDRTQNRYHLSLEYDKNVSARNSCNVTYSCYRLDPGSLTGDNIFYAYLTARDRMTEVSGNLIPAGTDQVNSKTGTVQLYVPRKGEYILNVKERALNHDLTGGFPIFVTERNVEVDMLAGGAAGLITLLGLIGATALFTNEVLRANEQTMITLAVSTFIAGFIPFQIIEKAAGQLKDRINFLSEDLAREKANTEKEASEKDTMSSRLTLSKTIERNQMSTMNMLSLRLRDGYRAPPQPLALGQRFDPIHEMLVTGQVIPSILISQLVRDAMRRMEDVGIDRIIVNEEPDPLRPARSYVLLSARIELEDLNEPISEILTKLDQI